MQCEWPMIRAAPDTAAFVAITSALLMGTGIIFYEEHHYSERFATFGEWALRIGWTEPPGD